VKVDDENSDLTTLGSTIVYENRWMKVREDRIRRKDGSLGIYGVVDKPDFVIIVPVQDGVVHLVRQYRYPVAKRQWEFPQGSWEDRPDADPQDLARGELQEESGLLADDIRIVGELFPLYGTVTQRYRIYLATDLRQGRRQPDPEEQDLVTAAFTIAELERMILDGTIQDAGTVASFGLLRLKGLI